MRIEIANQPGAHASVACLTGAGIIKLRYQRMLFDPPVKRADLDVSLETRNPAHVGEIVSPLDQAGLPTRHLSSHSTKG